MSAPRAILLTFVLLVTLNLTLTLTLGVALDAWVLTGPSSYPPDTSMTLTEGSSTLCAEGIGHSRVGTASFNVVALALSLTILLVMAFALFFLKRDSARACCARTRERCGTSGVWKHPRMSLNDSLQETDADGGLVGGYVAVDAGRANVV